MRVVVTGTRSGIGEALDDTDDELRSMVRDAVACLFDDAERPSVIRLHFVREEMLTA